MPLSELHAGPDIPETAIIAEGRSVDILVAIARQARVRIDRTKVLVRIIVEQVLDTGRQAEIIVELISSLDIGDDFVPEGLGSAAAGGHGELVIIVHARQ